GRDDVGGKEGRRPGSVRLHTSTLGAASDIRGHTVCEGGAPCSTVMETVGFISAHHCHPGERCPPSPRRTVRLACRSPSSCTPRVPLRAKKRCTRLFVSWQRQDRIFFLSPTARAARQAAARSRCCASSARTPLSSRLLISHAWATPMRGRPASSAN